MQLVFLYGPAAVGKLTVAQELAKLTGYALFDNHLSIDYAARLLEWNTPDYVKLLRGLRLFTLQKLAEIGLEGVIFTFVYTPPGSDEFIQQVLEVCQSSGIEPVFVKLEARREVLLERVVSPERKAHKKLSRPERLIRMLDDQRATEAIPFVLSLTVDTSDQGPEDSARQIMRGLKLP
ncbi:MAG: AAA family ATPase [Meiothermus sp.]|nr:AAA family ATPase [Meiothermus sp.]